jgi:squalene cyclase
MRTTVDTMTVPRTTVTVTIEFQPADPRLAALLKDRPGRGSWVDRWYVTRHPNGALFCNYLHTARRTEAEIREEADFLYNDAVTRRRSPLPRVSLTCSGCGR